MPELRTVFQAMFQNCKPWNLTNGERAKEMSYAIPKQYFSKYLSVRSTVLKVL